MAPHDASATASRGFPEHVKSRVSLVEHRVARHQSILQGCVEQRQQVHQICRFLPLRGRLGYRLTDPASRRLLARHAKTFADRHPRTIPGPALLLKTAGLNPGSLKSDG